MTRFLNEKTSRRALLTGAFALIALIPLTRIADFDLFFHLRLGQSLVQNFALYSLDQFSYPTLGKAQFTGEWLSNLIIYLAYQAHGYYGLGMLKSALFALTALFLYRAVRHADKSGDAHSVNSTHALAIAISLTVFALAMRFRLDLRPYYATYLSMAAFLAIIYRHKNSGGGLYWLALIQVIWGNTHPGYIIGPLFTGLYFCSELIRRREIPKDIVIPALLVFAATAMNPEAIKHFNPIGDTELITATSRGAGKLGEWQPLSRELLWGYGLRYTFGYQIMVAGALIHLISSAMKKRLDPFEVGLFAVSVFYPIKYVRVISMAAILLFPMFCKFISQMITLLPKRDRILPYLYPAFTLAMILFMAFGIVGGRYYTFGFGPKPGTFPDRALAFLDRNHIEGKGFNTVTVGSYMLWAAPHRQPLIDGRLVPSDDVESLYEEAVKNREGMKKLDARFGLTHAIVDYNPKARWRFPSYLNYTTGWALVYWDDTAAVYLRDLPQNARLTDNAYIILRPSFGDFAYLDHYLSGKNSPDDLIRQIDHDIAIDPANIEALLAKAYACYYLGLKKTAYETLKRAVSVGPRNALARISLAQLEWEAGMRDAAKSDLAQALEIEPENPTAKQLGDMFKSK